MEKSNLDGRMIKSNLIELICSLNSKEFKKFGEYIRSPFFNKNQSVIRLYEYIDKYYPDFKEENFERQIVYKKIFPETSYNEGFLRTMTFNLTRLLEDYLSYNHYSNSTFHKEIHLINELHDRKIGKQFLKKLSELEDSIDMEYRDGAFYKNKYDIESIKAHYFTTVLNYYTDYKKLIQFTETKYLINYFLIEILSDYRNYLNLSRTLNYDFDLNIFEYFLKFIKENQWALETLHVKVHYYEAMLLKEGSDDYYYKLKALLLNEMGNLNQDTKYSIITILLNHTFTQYYSGKKKFLNERFDLCKVRLENNIYTKTPEGYLGENVFDVTLNSAILINEYAWAEQFIANYKNLLQPELRENITNYAYSCLYFARGNFEKSSEFLSKVSIPRYFSLKIGVKVLSMMVYYETNLLETAFDAVDSYRHFLLNDKIMPEWRKQLYRNFLKFFNIILKMKSSKNMKNLDRLKSQLKNTHNIIQKDWFIKKTTELEKKKV